MLLIAAFLRATALVIAGYFVWFAASKADDRLKAVGKYIAIWCAAFAAVLVVIGIATAFMRPMGFHGPRPGMMHGGMMHGGMMHGGMMPGPMMRGGMFPGGGPRFRFRDRMAPPDAKPEPNAETPAPKS
ncbi:MAG: hypothetical protein K1X51_11075 [Rhodospirillaceae bacterium]|nr:hypothetical protein [Rhodospirillaceae bacterium]